MKKPDTSIVRRLAFAKYLHGVGIDQANKAEPLSSTSILTFHDAIELYFQIASEHLDIYVDPRKNTFLMNYFDLLKPKLPESVEVFKRASVKRLNSARIALKHHGTLPSKFDIESFRVAVSEFFTDNTPIIFGIEFSQISLVEFVNPERVRTHLKEAEAVCEKGELSPGTR